MNPSPWHLELFGGLRAVRAGRSKAAPIENFGTQKAASLLAFLAFHRQAQRREVLAELFWPDTTPDKAHNSLRVALSGLRKGFKTSESEPEVLVATRDSIALASHVSTDVELFHRRLQDAHAAPETERLLQLERAVALVRGPLLRGFYDDWISGEAARLEDEFLGALREMIVAYEDRHDLPAALDAARRGTIAAPLREGAMRDLVRLGVACGQEKTVKGEYEDFRRRVGRGGNPPPNWDEFLRRAVQSAPPRRLSTRIEPSIDSLRARAIALAPTNSETGATSEATTTWPRSTGGSRVARVRPLPSVATSFVGRASDVALLRELLVCPATRLVTLTGPGGAGKTRLALETAQGLANRPDENALTNLCAVVWLPLANLPSSRLLPGALLDALGSPAFKEDMNTVVLMLRQLAGEAVFPDEAVEPSSFPRRVLLVVDNCEQLAQSHAFVADLLARVPILTVLATSRAPLGLRGEQRYPLASLDAPPQEAYGDWNGQAKMPANSVDAPSDAIRLFVERAQEAKPDFALNAQNAPLVSAICARLDGLPLALEIAAARVAAHSLEHIARGLGALAAAKATPMASDVDALDGSPRNSSLRVKTMPTARTAAVLESLSQGLALEADALIGALGPLDWPHPNPQAVRHSSLRTAIEWSVEQLSPAQHRFWTRASVFPLSLSIEAAAEICEAPDARALLSALQAASLLGETKPNAPATPRADWLHTLRDFAAQTLAPDHKARLEARHAAYFLRWIEELPFKLDAQQTERLAIEAVNLRVALDWLVEHDIEGALRFAGTLLRQSENANRLIEASYPIETVLQRANTDVEALEAQIRTGNLGAMSGARERLRLRAQAFEGAGKLADLASDHIVAESRLARAQHFDTLLGDTPGVARCLSWRGANALRQGAASQAQSLCQEGLLLARQSEDAEVMNAALQQSALVALGNGDTVLVRTLNAERIPLCQSRGDHTGLAAALESLGFAALLDGDFAGAAKLLEECVKAFERLHDAVSLARSERGLGQIALSQLRFDAARDHLLHAAALTRPVMNGWDTPLLLEAFGALAVAQGGHRHAATLLGGAAGLRERQGEPLPTSHPESEFEALCQTARDALGEARFAHHWHQGHRLDRTQLLDLAQSPPA